MQLGGICSRLELNSSPMDYACQEPPDLADRDCRAEPKVLEEPAYRPGKGSGERLDSLPDRLASQTVLFGQE